MTELFPFITAHQLLLALGVGLIAGVVKGMVGFAMPLILISGLSAFLPPEIALAALILPTVATNLIQALSRGVPAFWATARDFRLFLLAGLMTLVLSAAMVRALPKEVLFLSIGGMVVVFTAAQLAGYAPHLSRRMAWLEALVGGFAGLAGGISGVWGPPTVMYLTALDVEKTEHVRVQSIVYLLGAIALMFAHLGSGVLSRETAPFSALMVVPAFAGTLVGMQFQKRIDQKTFRRATLWVLAVAGLNLLRRGLM